MDRRQFIKAAGLGALSLAASPAVAAGSVPAPVVPSDALAERGWERIEQRRGTVLKREVGPGVTVTGTAHTLTYEDAALRADVREKTLGSIDFAPSSFFASRLDFSPPVDDIPDSAERDRVNEQITANSKSRFEKRLRKSGLTDVRETGTEELTVETGETATLHRYAATYAFDDLVFSTPDGPTITIEGDSLAIDAWLAIWRRNDATLLAGGGYPAENFADRIERSLTDAIDLTVTVDLGLTPDAYREELLALTTAVR